MKRFGGIVIALLVAAATLVVTLTGVNAPAHALTRATTTITSSVVRVGDPMDFDYEVTVRVTSPSGTPTGSISFWNPHGSMGYYMGGVPDTYPLDATGSATFAWSADWEVLFHGYATDVHGVPDVDWGIPDVTYSGDATHQASSGDIVYRYARKPVVLTAAPVVKTVGLTTTFTLRATLRYEDGTPVVGRTLTVYKGRALPSPDATSRIVCRPTTNSSGVATCTSGQALQVWLSGGGWVTSPLTPQDEDAQLQLVMR